MKCLGPVGLPRIVVVHGGPMALKKSQLQLHKFKFGGGNYWIYFKLRGKYSTLEMVRIEQQTDTDRFILEGLHKEAIRRAFMKSLDYHRP